MLLSGRDGWVQTTHYHFLCQTFIPHKEEFYLNVVSERLGSSISFSECSGIELEKTTRTRSKLFLFQQVPLSLQKYALLSLLPCPWSKYLVTVDANMHRGEKPLVIRGVIEEFVKVVFALFQDLNFTLLEMRGEPDDTAAFKNFKKWGKIEFPMPFRRVMSPTETLKDQCISQVHSFEGIIWTMVAGGGASIIYTDTLEILGMPSSSVTMHSTVGLPMKRKSCSMPVLLLIVQLLTLMGHKRALVIGGGIAIFTDASASFNTIIHALKESKLKAARIHIYVRRRGPNYQKGLGKMRALREEIGIPIEVYGREATMTGICKQAIECITAAA